MRTERKVVLSGFAFGAAFWAADAFLDAIFYQRGYLDSLLGYIPLPDLLFRIITATLFIAFGFILGQFAARQRRIQETLGRRESYFRSILNQLNEDVLVINRDFRITDVNEAALRTTGRKRDDVIGKHCFEVLHGFDEPCDRHDVKCGLSEVFESGKPRNCHHVYTRADGTRVYVDVAYSPLRDEAGNVTHVIEAGRDVSDLMTTQEALRESEEFNRRIIESSRDCIEVLDLEGRLTFMSEGGQKSREIDGITAYLRQPWIDFWEGEGREAAREAVAKAAAGATGAFEGFCPTVKGVPKWWGVVVSPIMAADGSVERILAVSRDITERKEGEASKLHGRMVVDAIADASLKYLETASIGSMAQIIVEHAVNITGACFGIVIDVDLEHRPRIIAVSDMAWETMKGKALYEEARREIDEKGFYFLPLGQSLVFAPLLQGSAVLTNSPTQHPDWAGKMPDGHPPVESFLGVPMRIGEEVAGMIALANRPGGFTQVQMEEAETFANTAALALRMARSEEERTRIEQQLRQAQKMEAIGQLAGGIAHDFNNLLQAMLGYLQFACEGLSPEDRRFQDLKQVEKGAEKAAAMTRQLLAFSRRQVLDKQDINVNDLMDEVLKMLRRLIGENIEFSYVPGHELGTVHADPAQFELVLVNLCINARDAMPQGGRLTIETNNVMIDNEYCKTHVWAKPGPHILLSVTDTGCGMNEETRRRVFEPFFTTKEPGRGTGLGLATVYGIVKQHGGMVHVYSEEDKGTTFKVYLPVVDRPAGEIEKRIEAPLRGGTETILLAEDDETVRTLATRVLEEGGYTVHAAADGLEAVEMFKAHAPKIALALLDVIMPKLSGREIYEEIRRIAPDLPVLFSSGYSINAIHTDFILNEGLQLLQKPYSPQALLRRVRELLDA